MTTHYLEEADALCDRVLVIDHGEIVAEGSPEELKRRVSGDAIELSFADGAAAELAAGVTGGTLDGAVVRLTVPSAVGALPQLFRALDDAGLEPAGVEVHRPTLDDVFLSLTGRALRDEVAA
jgi:ABC-2 type transport system ATP-binding protein